jgi:flagella basal body P-ring formation protein FlgA
MLFKRTILHILLVSSLLAWVGLCLSPPSQAVEQRGLEAWQLAKLFEKFIAADLPFPAEDLAISDFSSHPESLELPVGEIEYLFDMGPMTGRLGLRTFSLEVLVNGLPIGKVKMSGTVQLYGSVLSAARTLKRGTILSRQDLTQSRRNITQLGPDLAREPAMVVGKQLKTTLTPGSIIFTSLLKAPQIIKRGDLVTILAKSGQIRVSVTGKARGAGALGDVIKVKNMMSRREINARIINENEVQVEF